MGDHFRPVVSNQVCYVKTCDYSLYKRDPLDFYSSADTILSAILLNTLLTLDGINGEMTRLIAYKFLQHHRSIIHQCNKSLDCDIFTE